MPTADCPFCNEKFSFPDLKGVHEYRKNHIVQEHRPELGERFVESSYGEKCQGLGCSEPLSGDSEDLLICPACGHDHAKWAAAVLFADTWDIGDED